MTRQMRGIEARRIIRSVKELVGIIMLKLLAMKVIELLGCLAAFAKFISGVQIQCNYKMYTW